MSTYVETSVDRQLQYLHPIMVEPVLVFEKLIAEAEVSGLMKHRWRFFEGWRHPARQDMLRREGKTKVGRYYSAHQYGMAIDVAVFKPRNGGGTWSWAASQQEWKAMQAIAKRAGLTCPIAWDPGHLQHPAWKVLQDSLEAISEIYLTGQKPQLLS